MIAIDAPSPHEEGESEYFEVKIIIEALTPHFYPMVFTKLVESNIEPSNGLDGLGFPNINDYDRAFGENPFEQLHKHRFEYTFRDFTTKEYAYYTLAVYQQNWGLTDFRKSEF